MNRRQLMRLAALGAGALAVRRTGATARVSVMVASPLSLGGLPLGLAQRLGFFAAEGLDVRLDTDGVAESAAASGARVHAGSFDAVVQAHAEGQSRQVFAMLTRTLQVGVGWHVDAPQRQVGEGGWQGVRVGVLSHDASARLVWTHLLRSRGASAAAVAPMAYPSPEALTDDFLSRHIDAVCVADPLLTRLQRTGVLHLMLDFRDPDHSQRVFGGPVLGSCLSASPAVMQVHAAELQALARAVQRSLRWLQTASTVDLAAHAELLDLADDRALFLAILAHARASYVTEVVPQASAVRNTLRWLYPALGRARGETLEAVRWFTTRLAPAA